jgi:CRISPR-associated protein Csm2
MQHSQHSKQQNKTNNKNQEYLEERIPDILNFKHAGNINELLDHLQKYVEECGKHVTTHQLRNIFSKIKTGKTKTAQELQLIRPQLAYVAARQASGGAKSFIEFLEKIIRKVENDEQVKHFIAFFEAIVAYHKFYHGNKK